MVDLLAAVDAAFAVTSRGLRQWDDPHAGGMPPADDEYSRCTDPTKWRIIGAKAEAWIDALTQLGLATVERDVELVWPDDAPRPNRSDLVVPEADGALTLAIGHTAIDGVPGTGVVVGVAADRQLLAVVTFLPDCGCDACDSGSANELTVLDEEIGSVVSGAFRHLTRGGASITITERGRRASNLDRSVWSRAGDAVESVAFLASGRWSAAPADASVRLSGPRRGPRTRDRIDAVLADPTGWTDVSGEPWLTAPASARH